MTFKKAARIAASIFAREGWWYYGNEIPDAIRLERTMRSLWKTVTQDTRATSSETGRLVVYREKEEDGAEEIKLCLILKSEVYGVD